MTDRSDPGGGAGAAPSDQISNEKLRALRAAADAYLAADERGEVESLDGLERETQALIIAAQDLFDSEDVAAGGPPVPAHPVDDRLKQSLGELCFLIERGWIPPDEIDDYKSEGAWQMACRAFRDSRAYTEARTLLAELEAAAARPGEEPPDAVSEKADCDRG